MTEPTTWPASQELVEAFRGWHYENGRLLSLNAQEWKPGVVFEATCKNQHVAPHEGCTCGIYATSAENRLPLGHIFGKVKLWGKIIPGDPIRAQYGYPVEFRVPASLADAPGLKAFGVPIIVDARASAAAPAFGSPFWSAA
jgi:hypothetical protein